MALNQKLNRLSAKVLLHNCGNAILGLFYFTQGRRDIWCNAVRPSRLGRRSYSNRSQNLGFLFPRKIEGYAALATVSLSASTCAQVLRFLGYFISQGGGNACDTHSRHYAFNNSVILGFFKKEVL